MNEPKDTAEKCEKIVRLLLAKVNEESEPKVTFECDWGGNSMTISISGLGHTHVGIPELPFDVMLDNLIGALGNGPCLSFAPEPRHDP